MVVPGSPIASRVRKRVYGYSAFPMPAEALRSFVFGPIACRPASTFVRSNTRDETCHYTPGPLLDCPVSAFGGLADREISKAALEAWREQTRGFFTLRMFPGDHFYLHDARQPLLREVSQTLTRLLSSLDCYAHT